MPSPFPGMDPFLEHPEIWSGFHHAVAEEFRRRLNPQIGPKYYADVEIYTVPHDIDLEITNRVQPDVGVFEPFDASPEVMAGAGTLVAVSSPSIVRPAPMTYKLRSVRIYRTQTSQLVTTIELLSPYNKRVGSSGILEYRLKRAQILASHVHLVEIDLLRGGERPGFEFIDEPIDTDYIIVVNRFRPLERLSEIWPVALNEPLPIIPIPLLSPDPDVALDVNAAVHAVYAFAGYDWRIKYDLPVPSPPLRPEMRDWVATLLAKHASAPG